MQRAPGRRIAIVGTGISGMAAAWLLSDRHDVTVYERAHRLGGHTNTIDVSNGGVATAVDTGFIVYNEATYPNLMAMFDHLGVETKRSDMSFAVSLDEGRLEYSGTTIKGLFAQPRNLVNPRFWTMLRDIVRFYREAPAHAGKLGLISLGDFLAREGYGGAFRDDHLLPMAAAIWSAPARTLLDYPAESFIRFCENHGLLQLSTRPKWRTVVGGSRSYVDKLTGAYADRVRLNCGVESIRRVGGKVLVADKTGAVAEFDEVVLACHADQALAMLDEPSESERSVLGAFRYSRNFAVLHSDASLMPRRRAAWSSWNYLGVRQDAEHLCVTYWMNRLQDLPAQNDLFVTLNPKRAPQAGQLYHSEVYDHPIFDGAALSAQNRLWSLQGVRNTWFCGAYFGAGFHEDGLQAGLAVGEELGGTRRPWTVADESGRMPARGGWRAQDLSEAAA